MNNINKNCAAIKTKKEAAKETPAGKNVDSFKIVDIKYLTKYAAKRGRTIIP